MYDLPNQCSFSHAGWATNYQARSLADCPIKAARLIVPVDEGRKPTLDNFGRLKGSPYNVGLSEANLSKRELCREIQAQIPDFHIAEYALGKDPDKRDYIVSNAKIEAAGFKAARTLKEGIAELIKAYRLLPKFAYGNV